MGGIGEDEDTEQRARRPLLPGSGCFLNRTLLVQRIEYRNACLGVGTYPGRIDANYRIFLGAESADPGLVHRDGSCNDGVADIHAAGLAAGAGEKLVATLAAAGGIAIIRQNRIDHTRSGRTGNASRSQRSAEI